MTRGNLLHLLLCQRTNTLSRTLMLTGQPYLPDDINGRVTVLNHVVSAVEAHKNFSDLIIEQERPENYTVCAREVSKLTKELLYKVRHCCTGLRSAVAMKHYATSQSTEHAHGAQHRRCRGPQG